MVDIAVSLTGETWLWCGPDPVLTPPVDPEPDPDPDLDIPFAGGPLELYLRNPSILVDPRTFTPGCRVPIDQLEVLSPAQVAARAQATGHIERILCNGRLVIDQPWWGDVVGEDIVIYASGATTYASGDQSGTGRGIEAWVAVGSEARLPASGKRPWLDHVTILGSAAQPGWVDADPLRQTNQGVIGGPIRLTNLVVKACSTGFSLRRDCLIERYWVGDSHYGYPGDHVGTVKIEGTAGGTHVYRDGVHAGYYGDYGHYATVGGPVGSACVQLGSTMTSQINRLLFENVVLGGGSYGFQGPSSWRNGMTPPDDGFVSNDGWFAVRECKSLHDHRQAGVAWAGTGEATVDRSNIYLDTGQPWLP